MSDIKLAVWNMEWLNSLFKSGTAETEAEFKADDRGGDFGGGGRSVGERKALISQGLADLDADMIVINEGPNKTSELQLLFDELAPGDWVTYVQKSTSKNGPDREDTWTSSQCNGLAVRIDRGKFADNPATFFDAMDETAGRIFSSSEPFFMDIGQDKVPEWFRFERRPVYAEITLANGAMFRVLGVHMKSKGIFSAHEWSRWWAIADANRERLLAQCRRVREELIDPYLIEAETKDIPLLVCGDINDGPGFDASEKRLQASGVETLMGSVWRPQLALGNALFDALADRKKDALDFRDVSTTSFQDPIFNRTTHRVWIDHVLYSRNVPFDWVKDAKIMRRIEPDGPNYRRIADHYPVTATISLLAPPGA